MVIKQKAMGRSMTMPGGILFGGAMAMLWTVMSAAILGGLIHRELLPETAVGYGGIVILLTASLVGSLVAWRKIRHQRVIVCLSAGLAYFLMLIVLTALFFGGQFEAVGVTAFLIVSGSGTAVLMGMIPTRTGKGKFVGIRR